MPAKTDLLVIYRNPNELQPYSRNARTHSQEQILQIQNSIREFGFTNPVLLKDDERTIGAGHARTLAALALGLERIPTITLPGLTPAQWRAYVIADNKLALASGWDNELLKLELGELQGLGFDLKLTGFANAELKDVLFPSEGETSAGLYSSKLKTPSYIPKGDPPPVAELCDETTTTKLRVDILATNLPEDVAGFLLKAADRHTVFDFHKIADYYASAPPAVQRLMERSALVIIDFDSAIEYGFVRLHKAIAEMALKDDDEV